MVSKNLMAASTKPLIFTIVLIFCNNASVSQPEYNYENISGPYFGLKLPGKIPEKFPGKHYYRFFNHGKECYYTNNGIWYTKLENGRWIEPVNTGINYGEYSDFEMNISPDGKKIIFNSLNRPLPEGHANVRCQIWISERTADGWSEPKGYGFGGMFATMTEDGTIYYTNTDNRTSSYIACRKFVDGKFMDEEKILIGGAHPCISPDESYLIFDSHNRTRIGNCGLFISFKINNKWSEPANLGNYITQDNAALATLMSGGRYLSFNSRSGDYWWISSDIIMELKQEILKK